MIAKLHLFNPTMLRFGSIMGAGTASKNESGDNKKGVKICVSNKASLDLLDQAKTIEHFCYNNFDFLKADITKSKIVKKILKNIDIIIPLAALVGAPLCEKFKKEAISVNLESIKLIMKHIKKDQNAVEAFKKTSK